MKHLIPIFAVLFLAGCNAEEPEKVATGENYLPLQTGLYQIYSVSETVYNSGSSSTQEYQVKAIVVDSFALDNNTFVYVVHRSKKHDPASDWEELDTWSVQKDRKSVILSEGNVKFVKMTFPVSLASRWNANLYNALGEDEYEITDIHVGREVNGQSFDDTMTITQESNDDVIVYRDERSEIYARDVGLIYRRAVQLNYCTDDQCLGQQRVDYGSELTMEIIEYGKL